MSAMMIGGRTVTVDGEKVATLSFAGRLITVRRPGGEVAGRLFKISDEPPDLYEAYTAEHPAGATPSDRCLATDLTLAEGIALVLELEGSDA